MNTQREPVRIKFSVPGIPVAQPRQRHRVLTIGGRTIAQNYTPKAAPVNAFKAAVQLAFAGVHQGSPLAGPVRLAVLFVMPRPSRLIWKRRDMPRLWHEAKPDADNMLKSLKDALKGIAWRDDSQVCLVNAAKVVAAGDEQPGTHVVIGEIDDRVMLEEWT